MNTVMSGGRHHAWRRMAVDMALDGTRGPALDVATGTGDFAFHLAKRPSVSHVTGVDYTLEMLSVARRKSRRNGLSPRVSWMLADAHHLPYEDSRFACATVGFGIRNFIDVPRALKEMARVVKPGGRVTVLEIVRIDRKGLFGRLFPVYFRYATPWLGALLAGDREAYAYLPASVGEFLTVGEMRRMMEDAGLRNVATRGLALGSVAIQSGEVAK